MKGVGVGREDGTRDVVFINFLTKGELLMSTVQYESQ